MIAIPHIQYFPRSLTSLNIGYIEPDALELIVAQFAFLVDIEAHIWNNGFIKYTPSQLRSLFRRIAGLTQLTAIGGDLLHCMLAEEFDDHQGRRDNATDQFNFQLAKQRIHNFSESEYLAVLLPKVPQLKSLQVRSDVRSFDIEIIEHIIDPIILFGSSLTEVDLLITKNDAGNPNTIIDALALLHYCLVSLKCIAINSEGGVLDLHRLEVFHKLARLILCTDLPALADPAPIELHDHWFHKFFRLLTSIELLGDCPTHWSLMLTYWRAAHLDTPPPQLDELYEWPLFVLDDASSIDDDEWPLLFPLPVRFGYRRNPAKRTFNIYPRVIHLPHQIA